MEGKGGAKWLTDWHEDVLQAQARPVNRTCFHWKPDGLTLNAPAEPVQKPFFLAFDQYRIASDPEHTDDGLVRFQFAGKPVSPFRYSWNSVDVSHRRPNEPATRACE